MEHGWQPRHWALGTPRGRALLLAGLLVGTGGGEAPAPTEILSVRLTGAQRQQDRAQVHREGDGVLVEIWSGMGIGRAELSAPGGKWPPRLILRLHLQGLEGFEVDNGHLRLHTSLQSSAPHRQLGEIFRAGARAGASVDREDPHWIPLRIVSSQNPEAPQVPLQEGWIELTMPAPLLQGAPERLRIQWIDFYR